MMNGAPLIKANKDSLPVWMSGRANKLPCGMMKVGSEVVGRAV